MSKIIVFSIAKGGEGKSSLCSAMASALASGFTYNEGETEVTREPADVLILDIDPQGNTTSLFDSKIYETRNDVLPAVETVAGVYTNKIPLKDVIYPTTNEHLFIAPSHFDLRNVLGEGVYADYYEQRLIEELNKEEDGVALKDKYDYILIDCPSFVGGCLVNSAVAVATDLVLPVTPSEKSMNGIDQMYQLFGEMVNKHDAKINITIVPNRVELSIDRSKPDSKLKHIATRIILNELYNHEIYSRCVTKTMVPESNSEATADVYLRDSFTHNPKSTFSKAVMRLILEKF